MVKRLRPSGIVTLTSDFGTSDSYVGAMKGVMLRLAPSLRLVDIGHQVSPQDVIAGAAVIENAALEFPDGTVHLVVVDPGVGTERAPIAVWSDHQVFVGPDNGVFSPFFRTDGAVARMIDREGPLGPMLGARSSNTFHGRDIFAPVAALLASGMVRYQDVGPRLDPIQHSVSCPSVDEQGVIGTVVTIDHFGNCITNIRPAMLKDAIRSSRRVHLGAERDVPWLQTYGEVERGEGLALVGSGGFLEIAVRDGSAAERFSIERGHKVRIRRS